MTPQNTHTHTAQLSFRDFGLIRNWGENWLTFAGLSFNPPPQSPSWKPLLGFQAFWWRLEENPRVSPWIGRRAGFSKSSLTFRFLGFPFRMKDVNKKNHLFAQFRKNDRDKQKLIETVVRQLRGLANCIAQHP